MAPHGDGEIVQRVDLLVTDVGLPGGMNGRQVADAARLLHPQLKVLFITGYAENAARPAASRDGADCGLLLRRPVVSPPTLRPSQPPKD